MKLKINSEKLAGFYKNWLAPNKFAIVLAIVSLLTFAAVRGVDDWLTHRADRRFDQDQAGQREREAALLERAARAEGHAEARESRISELEALARDYEKQIDQLNNLTISIEQSREKGRKSYEADKKYIGSIAGDDAAVRRELVTRLERLGYLEEKDR